MQQIIRLYHQNKVKSYCTNTNENNCKSPSNYFSDNSIFIRIMDIFPYNFIWLGGLKNLDFSLKVTKVFSDNLLCENVFLSKLKNNIFMHLSIKGDDCNLSLKFIIFNFLLELVFKNTYFIFDCSTLMIMRSNSHYNHC